MLLTAVSRYYDHVLLSIIEEERRKKRKRRREKNEDRRSIIIIIHQQERRSNMSISNIVTKTTSAIPASEYDQDKRGQD